MEAVAGGRVDGKVDAGYRRTVRRPDGQTDDPGIGGMLCNSRAYDVKSSRT
jgi:hypothetical protein